MGQGITCSLNCGQLYRASQYEREPGSPRLARDNFDNFHPSDREREELLDGFLLLMGEGYDVALLFAEASLLHGKPSAFDRIVFDEAATGMPLFFHHRKT